MRNLTCIVAVCLLVGCTSPRPSPEFELTATEWWRIQTLAVAPGPGTTEVQLWVLNTKTGAMAGAEKAMEIANLLTMGFWPLAFYGAGAVCIPLLGAGVGALIGAIRAPEDEEVARIQGVLFDVITPGCLPQAMQDEVVAEGAIRAPRRTLVRLDAIPGESAWVRAPALQEDGIDAILELTISSIEVSGPFGTNRHGALRMLSQFQLIETQDAAVLFQGFHLQILTAEETGSWWLEPTEEKPDPSSTLHDALHAAVQASARAIAERVFQRGSDDPR